MTIFNRAVLVFFLVLLAGVGGTTLLLMYSETFGSLVLGEDTVYTAEYTDKGFSAVEFGMLTNEVRTLLGEPFRVANYDLNEAALSAWIYSMQNPTSTVRNFLMRVVEFDANGRVISKKTGLYVD